MTKQEIKKETDSWGKEKEVIYVDGKRVGETVREEGHLTRPGGIVYVTRDLQGRVVAEGEMHKDWTGQKDERITYDADGNRLSVTKFEGNKEVIHTAYSNIRIGEVKPEGGSGSAKVLHESLFGPQVDLLRKTERPHSEAVTPQRRPEPERKEERESDWGYGEERESRSRPRVAPKPQEKRPQIRDERLAGKSEAELSYLAHYEPRVDLRTTAVKSLSNQSDISYIAQHDTNVSVKVTAVNRLTDQATLSYIAQHDNYVSVRVTAVNRLNDQATLSYIAQHDPHCDVRTAAASRLNDQQALSSIAKYETHIDVKYAAISRLSNPQTLSYIARFETNHELRELAERRLAVVKEIEATRRNTTPTADTRVQKGKNSPPEKGQKKTPRGWRIF